MNRLTIKAEECLPEKRLWIFFDEFNTTPSIDLLKEVTCERTLLGRPLPENMVFLGACNPRRHKTNEEWTSFENNIGIKRDRYEMMKKLVGGKCLLYTVVPIPETMLEYIWDYGYLDQDTESAYIRTMLKTCTSLVEHESLFNALIRLISQSQLFIRKNEDVSSVSLRDVARFCRLYNWFYESIKVRSVNKSLSMLTIARRAAFAALFLCYYFRLPCVQLKNNYIDMLEENLTEVRSLLLMEKQSLIKQLEAEENELIEEMELPRGTAKNRALQENIFVLLVCIVNRIPVVLCGKPGCSKTSAVQIVISNLNGKKSKSEYFRTLPELITVSYQGSQNCTSDSIEKVFERASKYQKAQSEASSLLPVIVFDEIGLAELSPRNPLKVLHAELEVETCQYGFVGISNWRLDASKMNRVLYISCPDPDIDDLKITAKSIADDMLRGRSTASNLVSILNGLAEAYYELFIYLKTQQQNEYYFGLRDFYSLVKGVLDETHNMMIDNGENLFVVVHQQMKINFDGIIDGSEFMWKAFCNSLNHTELIDRYPAPTFRELIDRRIKTHSGRYLMIIGERDSSYDYVERYLRSITKWLSMQEHSVRTLIGSQMPGDLISNRTYTETYSYRVLMDIILHVETNVTLLMQHLGHLNDNLYDLFNQNFAVSAKKKYCRIALGALYHPRCLVNDDFFCIVFVNREEVEKCDPPFLNRFEKHMINIQDLVKPIHWQITKILLQWLTDFLPTENNIHFPCLQHLFIGYNPDYICNLVIDTCEEQRTDDNLDRKKVIKACKIKILQSCSFDLPLVLTTRTNEKKNQKLIQQYYDVHKRESFADVFAQHRGRRLHSASRSTPFITMHTRVAKKQIIYTYTQIYDIIQYDRNIMNEVKLSNFQTELEVINKIKEHFLKQKGQRIMIIRIDYLTEHKRLLSLKHILLNAIDDTSREPSDHRIWLVIHLQRNMLWEAKNDVLFHGWAIDMIDDLNTYNPISIETLMNPSYYHLITQEPFQLSEALFNELVNRTLSKLRYEVANNQLESRINQRRNTIINYLTQNNQSSLRTLIRNCLFQLIQTIQHERTDKRFSDWRKDLLSNGLIIATCRSLNDAFKATLVQFYETYFLLLFGHLERNGFIDSYLFTQQRDEEEQNILKEIWITCLKSSLNNIDRDTMNLDHVEIPLVFDLRLPCAMTEYNVLQRISKTLLQQQSQNDITVRDLNQQIWEKLYNKTTYGNTLINTILDHDKLFKHYYHDQLCFFLNENNIQLTTNFVLQMTSSNPTRSNKIRFQSLLTNWEEMIQIFRIFQLGTLFIEESSLLKTCKKQFIQIDNNEPSTHAIKKNRLYTLIQSKEAFFQLEPGKEDAKLKENLNDNRDVFIENSLMNLLELLQQPKYLRKCQSPEQLITTYNVIYHCVRTLTNYVIDNLERFSSHLSPIRSAATVIDEQHVKNIIQQVYTDDNTNHFVSCASIHEFVQRLTKNMDAVEDHIKADKTTVQRTLLKLENELLKNWLIDHGDQYCDVLTLIDRNDTDLWRFSAKIFLYISRRLNLIECIEKNHGQIPVDNRNFQRLNKYFKELPIQSSKIRLLLVNHLHTNLILSINENNFETMLEHEYKFFENNVNEVTQYLINGEQQLRLIGLLTWLKYFTQIYAFILYNDSHQDYMKQIDQFLSRNESAFGATLKLFILKQLVHMSKSTTLDEVREIFRHRNVVWLRPLLTCVEPMAINRDLVLPLPLFEGHEEFVMVNKILNNFGKIDQVKNLIKKCQDNQRLTYGFFSWFIQYYCRYLMPNVQIDQQFVQLFCIDMKQLLIDSFELIGFQLLVSLCNNFAVGSYFHLHSDMPKKELYCRLIALTIVAVCLSTKACPKTTYLGGLLFDQNQHMPKNYVNHIQSLCLIGMISRDPVVTQMIDVRTQIQDRLNKQSIHPGGMFIFQCCHDCHWMFYFENCGIPNESRKCPLCNRDIGAYQYNQLIQRNPPQIRMSIQDGLQKIEQYMKNYNSELRLGYHNVASAIELTPEEKPDHLNRTVSFRFLHMWTHAQLLFLYELKYLTDDDLLQKLKLPNTLHFQQHFVSDCGFMEGISTESEQYHIWLYKLINHMLDNKIDSVGILNTTEKVIKIEQSIEQQVIFRHIDSIVNEIGTYRRAYVDFVQKFDEEISLSNYVDELRQNDERYPLLSYFNVSRILTANPLDEFRLKIQNLPSADKIYPLATFLLKRLDEYSNITYLCPIMAFSKYLINKYNHRIQRNHAAIMTIEEAVERGGLDSQNMRLLLDQFIDAWYNITLQSVRHGCQAPQFVRQYPANEFASQTKLAYVLLNKSKDESSLLMIACIHTLANMQNEIVGYFRKMIINETTPITRIFLNTVKPEHLFQLDESEISHKIVKDSFVINYEYGQGRDLIYDYEEIEMEMRNFVSNLCLIDADSIPMLTYQFELYNENSSLITNIRRRINQIALSTVDRSKFKSLLVRMNHDDIVHCLGLLDDVFTYLCNIDDDVSDKTIQGFIEQHMNTNACLDASIFQRPPFSTILLINIIALYELTEEVAFDIVLRQ